MGEGERHPSDAGLPPPGTLIAGRYRVERLLGFGGMGSVLLARHEAVGQHVALKLLHLHAASDPGAVDRFHKEARVAASIQGEHVVRIYDVGITEHHRPYICMEYLRGRDLGQILEDEGPLPCLDVCTALLDAIFALSQAHAAGIVHRDLKPSNLFLAEQLVGKPVLKVLDFGIAKMEEGVGNVHATSTGTIMGTPAYMAPEQMRNTKMVDARADIWALGVIAYELVTGRLPFEGDSLGEILFAMVEKPPPPAHELRAGIPHELSKVIERCLQRDPKERYASVNDLADAIEPFATASRFGSSANLRRVITGAAPAARAFLENARTEKLDVAGTAPRTLSVWSTDGGHAQKRSGRVAAGAAALVVATVAAIAGGAAWKARAAARAGNVTSPAPDVAVAPVTTADVPPAMAPSASASEGLDGGAVIVGDPAARVPSRSGAGPGRNAATPASVVAVPGPAIHPVPPRAPGAPPVSATTKPSVDPGMEWEGVGGAGIGAKK